METYTEATTLSETDAPGGYSPGRAEAAIESLRAAIAATPARSPRMLSFADAAMLAGRLHTLATRPDLAARLGTLPASEFAPDTVERLEKAAWAAWYIDAKRVLPANPSRAVVPAALADAALAQKRQMLTVLDFGLRDDAAVVGVLAEIRVGQGYLDTTRDLVQLSELYREHGARLATRMPLDFRAADVDEALRLADEMRVTLGLGPVVVAGDDTNMRFWGLLWRVFNDVREALLFLLRHDEAAIAEVPSLTARRRVRTRDVPMGGGTEPGDDGDPGGGV